MIEYTESQRLQLGKFETFKTGIDDSNQLLGN